MVREAGAREAAEARLAGKTKADYSKWIVCFYFIKKEYNASYFEDCRRVIKRSILDVCEHLAPEQDAERAVLDTFD